MRGVRMTDLDLLGIGEAMIQLGPADGRSLARTTVLDVSVGGAEANVAVGLALTGRRVAWGSALGDDPFGDRILRDLAAAGVDVSLVERRPERTGVYVKDPAADGSAVFYYRSDSAASRLDADTARRWAAAGAPRIVHVSGITPLLSASTADLVDAVVRERCFGPALVSFDVNLREHLARPGSADLLRDLARASDLVFVGRDEAARLWGTATADDVRRVLDTPDVLVVKDGAHEAVSFDASGRTAVAAPAVEVVEPTGAGDAFAAGWLDAYLEGESPAARLVAGHAAAGAALRTRADMPGLAVVDDA